MNRFTRETPWWLWWAMLAFLVACVIQEGCRGVAYPPREQARSAVLVTSEAVKAFGIICARVSLAHEDKDLAITCRDSFDAAKFALISTADAVDRWNDSQTTRDNIICAVKHALDHLEPSLVKLRQKDTVVLVVDDARRILVALGPCHEVTP